MKGWWNNWLISLFELSEPSFFYYGFVKRVEFGGEIVNMITTRSQCHHSPICLSTHTTFKSQFVIFNSKYVWISQLFSCIMLGIIFLQSQN